MVTDKMLMFVVPMTSKHCGIMCEVRYYSVVKGFVMWVAGSLENATVVVSSSAVWTALLESTAMAISFSLLHQW